MAVLRTLTGLRRGPVDRDAGRHPPRSQVAHEGPDVEQLVRAQRDTTLARAAVEHGRGGAPLGGAGDVGEAGLRRLRKSRSPSRPGARGWPKPSLGRKLFTEPRASICVL